MNECRCTNTHKVEDGKCIRCGKPVGKTEGDTHMGNKALDKQIGGEHYKVAIQPWEYIEANQLDFFQGNVIKYVTRDKNRLEDYRKAKHYLEFLIEREEHKGYLGQDKAPMIKDLIGRILLDNDLSGENIVEDCFMIISETEALSTIGGKYIYPIRRFTIGSEDIELLDEKDDLAIEATMAIDALS